jgi:hypothetical protein
MTSSRTPKTDNVVPLRTPTSAIGLEPRGMAALYISQIALELEQLANTAGLELVSYFLTLARIEAETFARSSTPSATPSQAPYRVE